MPPLMFALAACAGLQVTVPTHPRLPPAASPDPEPDLSDAAFDESSLPSGLSPVDRVFERHLRAVGGRDAVEGHRSSRMTGRGTLLPSGDVVRVEVLREAPAQRLVRVDMGGYRGALLGFDGQVAWFDSTEGVGRFGAEEAWRQRRVSTFHGAARYDELFPAREVRETFVWEDMRVVHVYVTGAEGRAMSLFFAADTGLLAGEEWWVEQADGLPVRRANIYRHYKQRDDVYVPWEWTSVQGAARMVVAVERFEWDVPVDGFAPPPE